MGNKLDKQALQADQLAAMFASGASPYVAGNPGQTAYAAQLLDSAKGMIAAQAALIEKKKAEAKAKQAGYRKLAGTVVGTAVGAVAGGPVGASIGASLGGSLAGGDPGQTATMIQQGATGAALYTKAAGFMPGAGTGPDTTPITSTGATVDTQATDMLPPVNMPPDLTPLPGTPVAPKLTLGDRARGFIGQTPQDNDGAMYWDEGRQMYVKPARKRWF